MSASASTKTSAPIAAGRWAEPGWRRAVSCTAGTVRHSGAQRCFDMPWWTMRCAAAGGHGHGDCCLFSRAPSAVRCCWAARGRASPTLRCLCPGRRHSNASDPATATMKATVISSNLLDSLVVRSGCFNQSMAAISISRLNFLSKLLLMSFPCLVAANIPGSSFSYVSLSAKKTIGLLSSRGNKG